MQRFSRAWLVAVTATLEATISNKEAELATLDLTPGLVTSPAATPSSASKKPVIYAAIAGFLAIRFGSTPR